MTCECGVVAATRLANRGLEVLRDLASPSAARGMSGGTLLRHIGGPKSVFGYGYLISVTCTNIETLQSTEITRYRY